MNAMQSKYGVTNKRWADADLAKLEAAWNEVVVPKRARRTRCSRRPPRATASWRAVYKGWGDAQSLDSTYLE